jgi:hypothetical protein
MGVFEKYHKSHDFLFISYDSKYCFDSNVVTVCMSQIAAAAQSDIQDGSRHIWQLTSTPNNGHWTMYMCTECGTNFKHFYTMQRDILAAMHNDRVPKQCSNVKIEGVRHAPSIAQGGKHTHIDFSHGGQVDKVTVGKGGCVSMNF